jgi:hypothetical protein
MPALRLLLVPMSLLFALPAAAQAPPPFELDGDASRSVQVVRMQLGLRDLEEPSSTDSDFEAQSPFQATLNRSQTTGVTGTGRLVMFPLGILFAPLPTAGGQLLPVQPVDSGSTSFLVLESPSVTGGFYAPYVPVGTYDYDITCSAVACGQWLEGPIESRAESSFDHTAGTLEVDASVVTPDYGVTDDTRNLYHAIRSTAFARLGDWIFATGPGATATLVVEATLPAALDKPDDDADDGVGPSDWITQGSGDLRNIPCNDPIEPNVHQYTRFRLDFELTRWRFEEVCEEDGEGGEPICNDEWVDTPLGTHTVTRTREMTSANCESTLVLVPNDTGALPGSTQLELEVPTDEWVQLYVTTSTDADCEGAMACNLDAQTSVPIAVSVSSPNGELVSWQGIAGLTTVPEPDPALSIAAASGAVSWLARRRTRPRSRCPQRVPAGSDSSSRMACS